MLINFSYLIVFSGCISFISKEGDVIGSILAGSCGVIMIVGVGFFFKITKKNEEEKKNDEEEI